MAKKKYADITIPINQLVNEVNKCFDENIEEKYFQNLILLNSFYENILKWLIFIQFCWNKSSPRAKNKGEIEDETYATMRNYCSQLTFYQAESLALTMDLIDLSLHKKIQHSRKQRNGILHDLWLFEHRNNHAFLRKELENLTTATNDLMAVFNKLTRKIGVDEVYQTML